MSTAITFRPIGHVENAFDEPVGPDNMRGAESRIILDPEMTSGLTGLERYQRIMIVFYFHLIEDYTLLQHRRGDPTQPERGVFALRSPSRPNPIGVTTVDLLEIEGNVLRVRGLDAVNGTPVLDIKPA